MPVKSSLTFIVVSQLDLSAMCTLYSYEVILRS